jgi:membrane-associated phospholipid phosphatase
MCWITLLMMPMTIKSVAFSLRMYVLCSILLIVAIIGSYFYLDRTVVTWLVQHHSRDVFWFKIMANWLVQAMMIVVPLFYLSAAVAFYMRRLGDRMQQVLLACHATVLAYVMDHFFKFIFARTWPATFSCDNISWLRDGVYDFHWFKSGVAYGSFPSGHTAWASATACAVAMLYPKSRILCSLLLFTVMFGLIVMYYHFVSDVLAGMLLGMWTAKVCVDVAKTSPPTQ